MEARPEPGLERLAGDRRGPNHGGPARARGARRRSRSSGSTSPGRWPGCRHRVCLTRPAAEPSPPPTSRRRPAAGRRGRDRRPAGPGDPLPPPRRSVGRSDRRASSRAPTSGRPRDLITLPVALALRRSLGGRVVYDARDLQVESSRFARLPGPWRRLLARRERTWARSADAVLTVNRPYAEVLERKLGVRPTIVFNGPAVDRRGVAGADPRASSASSRPPGSSSAWATSAPSRGVEQLCRAIGRRARGRPPRRRSRGRVPDRLRDEAAPSARRRPDPVPARGDPGRRSRPGPPPRTSPRCRSSRRPSTIG